MFIFYFYGVWYILWIPMLAMLSSGGRFLDPCPMIGFINQLIRPFLVSKISPWHILLHLVCLMIFWILLPSLPAFLMCPRARWIGKCFVEYLCFVPLFACSLVSPRAWRAASINSVAILLHLNSYFFLDLPLLMTSPRGLGEYSPHDLRIMNVFPFVMIFILLNHPQVSESS